jgi:recombination protein RecA
MADSNREKALHLALGTIEKAYGKGSIMRLGDAAARVKVPVISSGAISLDLALGVGGYPRGRIVEIYGPESSGKTTLTLHAIAPSYARKLGVNVDELLVSQPDNGEQALEIADTLVRSGAVDIIVIDSVAALVPRAEIEGEMGDSHVGLQARLMSQALRKLTGNLQKSNATLFFINQIRMKIGVMFGSPETTSGGNALKFYASQRLDIRRIGTIKVGEAAVGNRCRVKVVKNKLAPPFRLSEFDILFGKGISRTGDVLDLGVEAGIVQKSGAWYSYGDERVGQGRDNARTFLEEHPDVLAQIERKLLQQHGLVEDDTPADAKAEAIPAAPAAAAQAPSKRPRPN